VYPRRVEPETETRAAKPPPRLRNRARVWVAGTALWLWVLASLLPMLELGIGGLIQALFAVLFPLTVLLGLALDELAQRRSEPWARRLAETILLGGAPLVVVASLATRTELTSREVLGPTHVALVVLAAAAYLGANAQLSASHAPRRRAQAHPLPPSARIAEPRWPRTLRLVLVATTATSAVALVAFAPLATGHAARVARYGLDGAEAAALLASAVGTALGVLILGAVVAPAMRARPAADRLPARWRGSASILVAVLAFAGWLWLVTLR
jgi:hypothetical protein